jgi:hypothetical protein
VRLRPKRAFPLNLALQHNPLRFSLGMNSLHPNNSVAFSRRSFSIYLTHRRPRRDRPERLITSQARALRGKPRFGRSLTLPAASPSCGALPRIT